MGREQGREEDHITHLSFMELFLSLSRPLQGNIQTTSKSAVSFHSKKQRVKRASPSLLPLFTVTSVSYC